MTEPSKETEAEILARRQVEALERIADLLAHVAFGSAILTAGSTQSPNTTTQAMVRIARNAIGKGCP